MTWTGVREWDQQEADEQQASLEAAGNAWAKRQRIVRFRRLLDPMSAAKVCGHPGTDPKWMSGYPLRSIAAINASDPRKGETGFRCCNCGSAVADDGTVIDPCEYPQRP